LLALTHTGTQIRPSRKHGTWRHGEREKDSFGDYLPEESSAVDDDQDEDSDGKGGYSDTDDGALGHIKSAV